MKREVAAWLASLDGVTDVQPVTMTIEEQSWEGAVYTQRDARRYYLVGTMPKNGTRKMCFNLPGDNRDWYVAGYFQDDVELLPAHQQLYHPFGNSWMLFAWDDRHGTIDEHEHTPYKRVPMTCE